MQLNVQLLQQNAKAPARGSEYAAGYDLYTPVAFTVQARSRLLVPLGIAVEIPLGYYGRIAPRSSLAVKFNIDVGAGVVDADYRGELKVCLINDSDVPVSFEVGERIAQLLLERIANPPVEVVEKLSETVRGAGGFGSTGKGHLEEKQPGGQFSIGHLLVVILIAMAITSAMAALQQLQ